MSFFPQIFIANFSLFLFKVILCVKKIVHSMRWFSIVWKDESTKFAGVCIIYGINHGIFSYCTVYYLQTNVFKFQNIETDNISCLST